MFKNKYSLSKNEKYAKQLAWMHWFSFFNVIIAITAGFSYVVISDNPSSILGGAYSIIYTLAHFSFLVSVIYLLIYFPLSMLFYSSRKIRIAFVIIAISFQLLLFIDILLFAKYRLHLNWDFLSFYFYHLDDVAASDIIMIVFYFLIITALESSFALWSFKKLRSLNKRKQLVLPIIFLLSLCFIASHCLFIWAKAHFYRPITSQQTALPLSYSLTNQNTLNKLSDDYQDESESHFQNQFNVSSIKYPLTPLKIKEQSPALNILLFVVDNLPDDFDLNEMPYLSKFANQHHLFTNHHSSSYQDYLGEFSLFYGLDPNYYPSVLVNHQTSALFDILMRKNYQLGLFASDDFAHALYHQALLSDFSLVKDDAKAVKNNPTSLWLNWFENQKESDMPWFSVIKYQLNESLNQKQTLKALDDDFYKVIHQVTPQLKNTMVIFTASNAALADDKNRISSNELKVPLVIAFDNKNHQITNKITTHADILPTIMKHALFVTSSPRVFSQGDDLFDLSEKNWLIAGDESKLMAFNQNYVLNIDREGRYQLFDNKLKRLKNNQIRLSDYLEVIRENRRFIIEN